MFKIIVPLLSLVVALPIAHSEVVAENEIALGFSLYSSLPKNPEENLVFSPCSLFTCLSMLYVGAREETAREIEKVLQVNLSRKALVKENVEILQVLKPHEGPNPYVLKIANSLWLDRKIAPLSDFKHTLQKNFEAKLGLVSFGLADKSIGQINEWVSSQTEGKIGQLLTRQDVSPTTRLILVNALYFQGQWGSPFAEDATQNSDFSVSKEKTVQVPMMHQTEKFPYFENKSFQLLALPFTGMTQEEGQLACLILLPKSGDLSDVQEMVNLENWEDWLSQLQEKTVSVTLPKFKLSKRMELNKVLSNLGMPNAFSSEADFSGIDGMHDLYLDKVIHAADIELNEAGLTAAAATSASMKMKGALQTPITFTADHPFLFFVVDLDSTLLLFMGHMQSPLQESSE